ncbi:MAG: homocysteine S-methyltransferase family protein [Verrucomicrobia bacterium]|nr:homocysteine S-methyltransferase family protein [Verrucomicrobiota bacterium]
MHPFIKQLIADGPIITDGAWGTELQKRGLQVGEFPDAWNLFHPERVTEVARAYVDAGSQIILTNTFGANRLRLDDAELAGKVVPINRKGVQISRRAADGRAYVFAAIGPSGKLLLGGDLSLDELRAAFDEQAEALADAGADALVVETMAELAEAETAVKAARATGLPVVACMVFDSGKNKDRTMMGTTPEEAAQALTAAGADVIGANCGVGIESIVAVCQRLRAATDRPIWIKPNAGLPELSDGQPVYRTTPAAFASHVPALLAAGASFVGGCCGTSPAFIEALEQKIEEGCPPV